MKPQTIRINLRLDSQLVEQLDAARAGLPGQPSRNAMIVRAIRSFLEPGEADSTWRWFLDRF